MVTEDVDVKPRISQIDFTRLAPRASRSPTKAKTPRSSQVVKKEPGLSASVIKPPVIIGSPIYISSDSDAEVDAQMDEDKEDDKVDESREEDKPEESTAGSRKGNDEDVGKDENEQGEKDKDEQEPEDEDVDMDNRESVEKRDDGEAANEDEDEMRDDSDGDMYADPLAPRQQKDKAPAAEALPSPRRSPTPIIPEPDTAPLEETHKAPTPPADPLERRSSSPEEFPCSQAMLDQLRPRGPTPKPAPRPKMRPPSASQPTPQRKRPSSAYFHKTMVEAPPPSQPTPSRPFLEPIKRSISVASDAEEEEPQPKRVKLQTSSSPAAPRRLSRTQKDEEYWLLDGSIILQVQNTQFRLHRSRLAQDSKFLAEMFKSPDGNGNFIGHRENCKAYKIDNVTVGDLKYLLNALDKSVDYFFTPPEFDELAGILRAARALSFTRYDAFATRFLREMWPTDLSKPAKGSARYAEETIVLARSCGLPELLKRAFYVLLCTPQLAQGPRDDDDGDDSADSAYDDDVQTHRPRLSRADLAHVIHARQEMYAEWYRGAGLPPDPTMFPCPLSAPATKDSDPARRCADAMSRSLVLWREMVVGEGIFTEYMNDPITGLARIAELDWTGAGFCPGCVRAFREGWIAQKNKLWENLEVWLELPADRQA